MKRHILAILTLLLCGISANAQIKSLSELRSNKKYVLRNTNGYGYCIYNPNIDEKNVMLGGITVVHPSGCANEAYLSPVDPANANNEWKISKSGNGYALLNLGNNMYLTQSKSEINFGGGWFNQTFYNYGSFYFSNDTSTDHVMEITTVQDGVFAIRSASANDDAWNVSQAYLCAASHSAQPMAAWEITDAGSTWAIFEADDAALKTIDGNDDNGNGGNGNSGDDGNGDDTGYTPIDSLGTLYYYTLNDGQMIVIPKQYVESESEEDGLVTLALKGDTTFTYLKSFLASRDTVYNGALPEFESFKFNNKFNDQLYTDAEGVIDSCTINLTVACIGKRLTPSFKVPEGAHVYINNVEQHSKTTRRRFDKDVVYTLAMPNNWIYRIEKVSDEVWSTPPTTDAEEWIATKVDLTADQLSSNWPSEDSDQQIGFILDGNIDTYFHSNWRTTNNWTEESYYGDDTTTWPYLQIDLAEPLSALKFGYTTRNSTSNGGYAPQGFIILGSNDGETWNEAYTMTADRDGMPTGQAQTFESSIISLGASYSKLRFQLTASTRKNYLVLSEFSLYKAEENPEYADINNFVPELIAPAVYKHNFVPFGRDYKVHVDFLTDHPTGDNAKYNVPRIDIRFGDGQTWSSSMWIGRYGKTYWEDGSIQIDGAGVFPDMPETPVHVRGRGNSSWSSSWSSKNPYRIKFDEKMKPLGMTKGKNWVLLANKQTGSMTTNAIAMKIADMAESAGCNHIIPVELYINGQYRGSYNFTEKIGFSNNSVDIDDESNAVMLELDTYTDEAIFYDDTYREPAKIKVPDLTDPNTTTNLLESEIRDAFNALTKATKRGTYPNLIDVDAFCRAMLVTDLTRNTEVQHPKSWYLYNENIKADSAWVFGPVWDFDWSFGYEGHNQYFIYDAESDLFNYSGTGIAFFKQLLRGSDIVKRQYYKLWTLFLKRDCMGELIEYCDDYFNYAQPSFKHNAEKHGDGSTYASVNEKAKEWLTKRANYIYSQLTPYDLSDDIDLSDDPDYDYGQPDRIDVAELTQEPVDVYTLQGVRVRTRVPYINFARNLTPGIYIVKGKKVLVR